MSIVDELRAGDKILSAAAPLTYTDHIMRRAANEIERLESAFQYIQQMAEPRWSVFAAKTLAHSAEVKQ